MKYRFQATSKIDSQSYHPYPCREIVYAYKNKPAVLAMIERIEAGEVGECEAADVDDLENYLLDGYVCCHHLNLWEEELENIMKFENPGSAAAEDFVIVFYEEEDNKIFDGFIAKCDEVVAVYQKLQGNKYKKINIKS